MLKSEEFVNLFLEDYSHKLAHNTLRGYKTALVQLIDFCAKSYDDISKREIRNWLMSLEEKGCKPNTINFKLKAIRLFYKYCVEEDYMSDNPVESIPDSKVDDKLPYYLSYEQLSLLRSICKEDLRLRGVIEVLYSTGIRISELANMKLNDINWTERMIIIPEGKGKKARSVFFTRECEEHLNAYLRTRHDNLSFVFINRFETTTIGTRTIVHWFKNYRKELGFYVSPHTLRHTFAAHLVMKGMPLVSIQTLLGHDDPRTTHTFLSLLKTPQILITKGFVAFLVDGVHQKESAINSTQAVVTFEREIGEATTTNFTVDNGLTVVKAEINPDNKKEVTLTFNKTLADKTDYKVIVNGVKSASGTELKEATTSTFTYEVGEVSKIELTKSTFVENEDIAEFVKLTNEKGTDVSDKYTVEISSTSAKVVSGVVTGVTESETAYVQVTVKSGTDIVKQSDAIKVTLTDNVVSSLEGFGLSNTNITTKAAYKTAVKEATLTSEMKKSAQPYLELLANVNGSETLLEGTDVTKIENLTPTVATVSKDASGDLVVDAYSTGTAQVKLTIGDYTATISFAVKADSVLTNATLSKSSVTFNTADGAASTSTANVNVVDQYGKDFEATVVGSTGVVSVGGTEVGTLTAKSSNNNVATATIGNVTTADSELPITITEVGKGTTTVTVTFKNTKGTEVFTKTLTVTGKDSGAFAGYSIETDATAIDLDKDAASEANDDEVNFKVYEVDAQGNKIGLTSSTVTLEIQGYDKDPEVKKYIDVDPTDLKVAVKDADAFKKFAGTGTLNVDVKVNGTKMGTKAITYSNTDSVATTATIDTASVVIDNDKITTTPNDALVLDELFTGHFNSTTGKYTVAPKLSVKDQSSKVIDFDTTSATAGTLVNTDVASGLTYTLTNVSSNLDTTTAAGEVSLKAGKDSGTFTVVVSKIDTANVNDILSAPVAFNVTIVD